MDQPVATWYGLCGGRVCHNNCVATYQVLLLTTGTSIRTNPIFKLLVTQSTLYDSYNNVCAPLSISGPPLTLSNVLKHVQGVHWRKLGKVLFYWDSVDLLNAIQTENASDQDCLHTVLEHWLTGKGRPPSWRMLAYSLHKEGELAVADSIREFAEPLPGEF